MTTGPTCCICDKDLSTNSLVYKCPACTRPYCQANCCKIHKEQFECTGVRDKTPYVHKSSYDEKQFIDDYLFLEEINQQIGTKQKLGGKIFQKFKNKKDEHKRHNRRKKHPVS